MDRGAGRPRCGSCARREDPTQEAPMSPGRVPAHAYRVPGRERTPQPVSSRPSWSSSQRVAYATSSGDGERRRRRGRGALCRMTGPASARTRLSRPYESASATRLSIGRSWPRVRSTDRLKRSVRQPAGSRCGWRRERGGARRPTAADERDSRGAGSWRVWAHPSGMSVAAPHQRRVAATSTSCYPGAGIRRT